MRRVFTCLTTAAVLLLCTAVTAEARPVVNFGSIAVGACNLGTDQGCTVRPVWFSNHSNDVVKFDTIRSDGIHFALAKTDTRPAQCENRFRIPAHGTCEVLVIGAADHMGQNTGSLELSSHNTPVRRAGLVITGR